MSEENEVMEPDKEKIVDEEIIDKAIENPVIEEEPIEEKPKRARPKKNDETENLKKEIEDLKKELEAANENRSTKLSKSNAKSYVKGVSQTKEVVYKDGKKKDIVVTEYKNGVIKRRLGSISKDGKKLLSR